jgi:hypothetical protein
LRLREPCKFVTPQGLELAPERRPQRAGFRMVGTLRAVGFKFGRWVDTVLMQRALGAGERTLPRDTGAQKGIGSGDG